jgi:hypothetical protein
VVALDVAELRDPVDVQVPSAEQRADLGKHVLRRSGELLEVDGQQVWKRALPVIKACGVDRRPVCPSVQPFADPFDVVASLLRQAAITDVGVVERPELVRWSALHHYDPNIRQTKPDLSDRLRAEGVVGRGDASGDASARTAKQRELPFERLRFCEQVATAELELAPHIEAMIGEGRNQRVQGSHRRSPAEPESEIPLAPAPLERASSTWVQKSISLTGGI